MSTTLGNPELHQILDVLLLEHRQIDLNARQVAVLALT
jgi:hypothetical protein